ncbi:hypothetical protein VOLCADRAFT_95112 [Volvox carteri f. nagariensis]|uniref:Smr domain-containing protein n=1 Tax=Volvox carteri f. nagariensis TaxID=3068 RepID=D8U6M4_VOLCA|nr:uncharacterized protein VOLCADRAFT_95112 [Volvox carteri f. nagariensis]EFJ44740.1 hypothetical protein VOLCADRAFT_95112 [Volvox carteri f. nagariensis]|eukprot:XP_002954316.1 hypothetical protein VOLCADRAFT_95112 [Volvox carteri f. nagariensis]
MQKSSPSVLPALQQMFPAMPEDILLAALNAHNNSVEDAIGTLLEMCAESREEAGASALTNTTDSPRSVVDEQRDARNFKSKGSEKGRIRKSNSASSSKGPSPPPTPNRSAVSAFDLPASTSIHHRGGSNHGATGNPRTTWAQLRTSQLRSHVKQLQGPQPSSTALQPPIAALNSPKYIDLSGGGAAVRLAATDFPDLQHCAVAAATDAQRVLVEPSTRGRAAAAAAAVAAAAAPPPPAYVHTGPAVAAALPPRPYGGYAAAARQTAHQAMRYMNIGDGMYDIMYGMRGAATTGTLEDEGWRAAAMEELCQSHAWAERDLVEAICMALQYDLAEVVTALDELHAASYQYDNSGGSASPTATSDDDDDGDGEEDGGGFNDSARGGGGADGAAAAADLYDFAAQRDGGAAGGSRSRHRDAAASGGGDAYFRHRHAALKLDYAWRKKMNKASAAFAAGARALGQRLVSEAQELRRQAAAAHREAAEQIVAEMNQGRQLSEWELDLHGLHAAEAVEQLMPTATVRQAPVVDTAAATAKLLAARRVLRVIVGKGLHSSRGEASLPRVVESYLIDKGYRYECMTYS